MKTFLLDYTVGNEKFCVEICAKTKKEAEKHLRSIAQNGEIIGELVIDNPWDDKHTGRIS